MAKKDITSGFDTQDAQDFLDGYREDAMPSYRKAKREPPATESPPAEVKDELARKPVTPDRTKEEDEYLRTFVGMDLGIIFCILSTSPSIRKAVRSWL